MSDGIYINFASPANHAVLAYLGITDLNEAIAYTADEIHALKLGMSLGTHPDLVDYFWGLAATLPMQCAAVINKRSYPILVNSTSGIIFGVAGGTRTIGFRLPDPERATALTGPGYGAEYKYPGSVVRAKEMGDDWVLVKPFEKINAAWCQKAFEYAGTLK